MPQMSPQSWMTLLLMSLITITLTQTTSHIKMMKTPPKSNPTIKKKKLLW